MKSTNRNIIILRGLPGSGKSTWAEDFMRKNSSYRIVSRDVFRAMFSDSSHNPAIESSINRLLECAIAELLKKEFNVIVDNMNLSAKNVEQICQIAKKIGNITVEEKFFEISLKNAIENDKKRGEKVGEDNIRAIHDRYIKGGGLRKFEKTYFPHFDKNILDQNILLQKAILCDIDGTAALISGRDPYEAENCYYDEINDSVRSCLVAMWKSDYKIIFLSGRSSEYQTETREFLNKHFDFEYSLFMRMRGDIRKDSTIKKEIFENNIKDKFYVEFILDDRQQVVDMWRDMGLCCFQVAEGNF